MEDEEGHASGNRAFLLSFSNWETKICIKLDFKLVNKFINYQISKAFSY